MCPSRSQVYAKIQVGDVFVAHKLRVICIRTGVRTLAKLRAQNVLDSTQRIKISRREVKGIFLRSIVTEEVWNRPRNPARQPVKL